MSKKNSTTRIRSSLSLKEEQEDDEDKEHSSKKLQVLNVKYEEDDLLRINGPLYTLYRPILAAIFEYMEFKDLLSLRTTCRKYKNVIEDDSQWKIWIEFQMKFDTLMNARSSDELSTFDNQCFQVASEGRSLFRRQEMDSLEFWQKVLLHVKGT